MKLHKYRVTMNARQLHQWATRAQNKLKRLENLIYEMAIDSPLEEEELEDLTKRIEEILAL